MGGNPRVFIRIQLRHLDATGEISCQLLYGGCKRMTGATPGCPKVDKNRHIGSFHDFTECRITQLNGTITSNHKRRLATTTLRLQPSLQLLNVDAVDSSTGGTTDNLRMNRHTQIILENSLKIANACTHLPGGALEVKYNQQTVNKKKLRSYLLKAFLLIILLSLIQFFFNPLGLGPEPASLLGPEFFQNTVKDMTDVELLVDGKQAFDAVFESLDSARESIYVQTYIWKSDETGETVVGKLKKAADRGVSVVVNKDLLGTAFELGDMVKGHPSPVFTSAGLKGYHGIDVNTKLFAYNDHSKYFIVDHEMVIFGGMNIADEYHYQWHDYMALFRGKERVRMFENRVLRGKTWPRGLPAVVGVNDDQATEIRTGLREMIDHAKRRIVVEHAYFSDDIIIRALLRAAKRGVNVDVILPANPDTHGHANQVTVNRLLESEHRDHIRIFLYPEMSHAKVLLTDGEIVGVGSANLTPRSMLTSKELTLFVHCQPDAPFIQKLRDQMDADLKKSTEVRERFDLTLKDQIRGFIGKYVW